MTAPIPMHLAAERYLAGEGTPALAACYGVTPATMRRRLAGAGVPIRPRGSEPKLSADQVATGKELDAKGLKRSYIAAVLGVCQTTLRRYLGNRRDPRPGVILVGGIAAKRCSSCLVHRALYDFHDDCTKADGMRSNCRYCVNAKPPDAQC